MEITVTKAAKLKQKPDEKALGFGKIFTDHMFIMEYEEGKGWYNPRVEPYRPFLIDPSSPVLHYGQEIFEGLKAYRSEEDDILLFRVKDNAKRMRESAIRMCMPPIDEDLFVSAVKTLVDIDRDWVPKPAGTSLYIRPAMISDGAELGVHASKRYIFFIICSPSGAYYKDGLTPISIYVEDAYVRAVKGGVGYAKTGGNYAASLRASEEAAKKGYSQILWLDGVKRKYIEEVGAMNIMFLLGDTLVTPALQGSILPGITRYSVIEIAKSMNIDVEEREISIDELLTAYEQGQLKEVFGTGTAAVISPIGVLGYKDQVLTINNDQIGPVTQKLYDMLTGIQKGSVKDSFQWTTRF